MMPLQHALKLQVADAEKLGSPKMDTLVGFHVDGWDDRIGGSSTVRSRSRDR